MALNTEGLNTEQLVVKIRELEAEIEGLQAQVGKPVHRPLPSTRRAVTHKTKIEGRSAIITVGMYGDGSPGEIFITVDNLGPTVKILLDVIAVQISKQLQYGIPLSEVLKKLRQVSFLPSGDTNNPDISSTSSIVDYAAQWLGQMFILGYKDANPPERLHPELPLKSC
jgi:ribonucleoside-diphosphate reductase alpha chain